MKISREVGENICRLAIRTIVGDAEIKFSRTGSHLVATVDVGGNYIGPSVQLCLFHHWISFRSTVFETSRMQFNPDGFPWSIAARLKSKVIEETTGNASVCPSGPLGDWANAQLVAIDAERARLLEEIDSRQQKMFLLARVVNAPVIET